MKLNLGKRIVFFLHWLLSLGLLVYSALVAFSVIPSNMLQRLLGNAYVPIARIAFVAIDAIFSLLTIVFLLKSGSKRSDRGFIVVDSSETGKVRIAVSAIEQMVKQAVSQDDGIADMKIVITGEEDALAIKVNMVMVNGSHVPTLTMNMQRSIRQFVEINCGVAVHSVAINIQSVVNAGDSTRKNRKNDVKPFTAASFEDNSKKPISDNATNTPIQPSIYENGSAVPLEDVDQISEDHSATDANCEIQNESIADNNLDFVVENETNDSEASENHA